VVKVMNKVIGANIFCLKGT